MAEPNGSSSDDEVVDMDEETAKKLDEYKDESTDSKSTEPVGKPANDLGNEE